MLCSPTRGDCVEWFNNLPDDPDAALVAVEYDPTTDSYAEIALSTSEHVLVRNQIWDLTGVTEIALSNQASPDPP